MFDLMQFIVYFMLIKYGYKNVLYFLLDNSLSRENLHKSRCSLMYLTLE